MGTKATITIMDDAAPLKPATDRQRAEILEWARRAEVSRAAGFEFHEDDPFARFMAEDGE
jgi:hypothetical protein